MTLSHRRDPFAGRLLAILLAATLLLPAAALAQDAPRGSTEADNDYFMATWLYNAGKYQLAADEYAKFLEKFPDHKHAPEALFGQAQAYFQIGKYKESAAAFTTLRSKHRTFAKSAEAQFQLGQCYLGTGQLEQAAKAFAETAERFKSHYLAEWADAKQAECLINLRKYGEAAGILDPLVNRYVRGKSADQRMSARKKDLSAINTELAGSFDALMTRADYNLALAHFGDKEYDAAARGFAAFLERNPQSELAESARFHRAQSLYYLGQHDQAAKAYGQVIQAKGPLAAAASFERALSIYKGGDQKAAAAAFAECAKDYPTTDRADRAQLYAGTCLYEAGDYKGAIEQLGKLIAAKSSQLTDEAMYWQGSSQLKLGQAGEAAKTAVAAMKAYPESPRLADMKLLAGDALLADGRFEPAADAFEKFHAEHSSHPFASRALYSASFSRHRAKQYQKSNELVAKFLAAYPSDPLLGQVLNIGGENHFLLKNYVEAGKRYQRILANHASDKELDIDRVRLRLGWCEYFQKHYGPAIAALGQISGKADAGIRREATYLKGMAEFELNKDADALASLNSYLGDSGEGSYVASVLYTVSLIHRRNDRRDEAIAPLEQLVKKYPDDALRTQAEFDLGEIRYQRKEYDAAIKHCQAVVKRDGDAELAPYAAFTIGLCHYDQGDWKQAAEAFAGVVRNYPKRDALMPQALYRQGLSLQKLEQWAVAESAFDQLVKKYPKDEYAPSALKAIGLGLEKQEKYDKAAEVFERLIKEYPNFKEVDQAWYELAWCHRELGNKDKMLAAYQKLADAHQDSDLVADAHYHLAERAYEQKDYTKAMSLYDKALASAKDDRLKDKALYRVGWCYWSTDRYDKAAEFFDKLITDYPQSSLLHFALLNSGEAHLKNDQPGKAAERLSTLLDKAPGDFEHLADGYLRLGEARVQLAKHGEALKTLEAARAKFPNYKHMPEVNFLIGRALFETRDYDQAIEELAKVTAAEQAGGSTKAKAQFYIGESHLAAGRAHDALTAFLRVTVLYASQTEWVAAANFELGQAYINLGQKPEAREAFQNVVDKYPKTKWAEQARNRLKQLGG